MYGGNTNAYRSKLDLAIKLLNVSVQPSFFSKFGNLPSPKIWAKIQPEGIFRSGEGDF